MHIQNVRIPFRLTSARRLSVGLLAGSAVVLLATASQLQPARASAAYDGAYRGNVSRVRGDDSCGKAGYRTTYTVVNGQFNILYDAPHHIGVTVSVDDNGSLQGHQSYMPSGSHASSQLVVTGRIAGGVMDGELDGMSCARHFHLTKR